MDLPASARYGIDAAPSGLHVVQDLLNTASAGRDAPSTDLLADGPAAQAWADAVSAALGLPPQRMTPRTRTRLRALRTVLRDTVHARDGRGAASPEPFAATTGLRLDPDGSVHADSVGLVETILLAVYSAQIRGDWPRLKLCALEICDLAFYDRTKNTGAKYHTARCANFVNLHHSRARKADPERRQG